MPVPDPLRRRDVQEKAEETWFKLTGGKSPSDVTQINRQQCINLCIEGYHSKDAALVDKLKQAVRKNAAIHFSIIDANGDGHITMEEYYTHCTKFGAQDSLRGTFEALDLNGDGEISREEMLTCYEGFHFSVDEERYNKVMGEITD